jgi:hypothetical protein
MAKRPRPQRRGEQEWLLREPVRLLPHGTGGSFVVGTKVPPPAGSTPGTKWVRVERSPATKAGFTALQFGYRLEAGAWKWTGMLIESSTGLTGRRLREVPKIVNLVDLARGWLDLGKPVPQVTAPRRRGRSGHTTEFWHQIVELHARAIRAAPHNHVVWMRDNLPAMKKMPPSLETVRRWDRLVRTGKKP